MKKGACAQKLACRENEPRKAMGQAARGNVLVVPHKGKYDYEPAQRERNAMEQVHWHGAAKSSESHDDDGY